MAAPTAYAQGFSDNELSYRIEPYATDPGDSDSAQPHGKVFTKNIVNFTHVDGGAIISNFLSMDVLKSNRDDPTNNISSGGNPEGATEFYGLYRGDVSSSFLTGGSTVSFGPVRDVTLSFGGDLETENNTFAPAKKDIVIGPNFHFDTAGFFNVATYFYKEWNHNGITNTNPSFSPTVQFAFVYMQPIPIAGLPLRLEGFTNLTAPKGKDGFEHKTTWELLTKIQATLDVGDLIGYKPRVLDAFVGFKYWWNKFGNNHVKYGNVADIETTPYFGVGVHF
jgi:hypothetical protein